MLIEFKAYNLEFVLADNNIHDPYLDAWTQQMYPDGKGVPLDAYGYNGLRVLKHVSRDESIICFAFLNLENVGDGTRVKNRYEYFEPRHNPVRIYKLSANKAILMQNPLPHWGVESEVRITAAEPHYLDLQISFITHKATENNRPLLILMPNYINAPEDTRIHFLADDHQWRQSADEGFTYAGSQRQKEYLLRCEKMILGSLHNEIVLSRPFYYGRWRDMVLAQFFKPDTDISLAVNPGGAGKGNPAWDVQFYLSAPCPYKKYTFMSRMVFKPFVSCDDVLAEYEYWLKA